MSVFCRGVRSPCRCEAGSPFCSASCCDDWAVQVGCGDAVRRDLFERERGVCVECGLDCHSLYLRLKPLGPARRRALLRQQMPSGLSERWRERIVRSCYEGHIWQADHVLAVADGGGQAAAGSENMQTLCVPCHQAKTRREAAARSGRGAGGRKRQRDAALPGKNKCRRCGQIKKGHTCSAPPVHPKA